VTFFARAQFGRRRLAYLAWRCLASPPPMGRTPRRSIRGSIRPCSRPPKGRARSSSTRSTNEQEGLPLFKIFRGGDRDQGRIYPQCRFDVDVARRHRISRQSEAWDLFHTTTVNKLPPPMLTQFEVPEVKNIAPEARDPDKRWYGVYANYNSPAYNTQKVKASDLPRTYEEFSPAQGMGRQGRHRRHR